MELVIICVCATVVVTIWFISGLLNTSKERREDVERRMQIENGVVKNNVKADNAVNGSDLDKRVRNKFGNR